MNEFAPTIISRDMRLLLRTDTALYVETVEQTFAITGGVNIERRLLRKEFQDEE